MPFINIDDKKIDNEAMLQSPSPDGPLSNDKKEEDSVNKLVIEDDVITKVDTYNVGALDNSPKNDLSVLHKASEEVVNMQTTKFETPKLEVTSKPEIVSTNASNQNAQVDGKVPDLAKPSMEVPEVVKGVVKIDILLEKLIEMKGSDLHIAVGFPPTVRVDGELVEVTNIDLEPKIVEDLLMEMLNEKQKKSLQEMYDIDFSYTVRNSGNRFRVNIYHSKGTLAAAFRFIATKIGTMGELGLPEILYESIKKPHGLILVTGPTGSGKSTTIASMIQEINMTEAKHIVTIEDPIEFVFPRGKSFVNQREIGNDASDWKRSLKVLLRQDPNVVLVGEMRDFETIAATITAAETGHLVFATLHTNSAAQTIDRIIDVFPELQQHQVRAQLASVINVIISQRLVPIKPKGRKPIFEILIANDAVKNAIREGKTYQIDNIIQTNTDQGMVTLEKSLSKLVRSGEIPLEKAYEYTIKPEELDSQLKNN